MAVLVTGGAGYIGSHTALALLDAGEEVIILDNLTTGRWWAVPKAAELVEGDIADEALLDHVLGSGRIDAILHFAGSIVVPDSVADPLGYYLNNTVKSRSLLASAVCNKVPRFIFSSTAAVYGNPTESPVSESAPPQPLSPYGASKLMTEQMMRDTQIAHGMACIALRYFNVAGADPEGRTGQSTPDATHLIKVACQTALGQRAQMSIFGTDYPTPDGTCVRDYIHVSDLARAHVDALLALRRGHTGGVFNCGYGTGYSVRDVIGAVERAAGHPLPVVMGPRRSGDATAVVAGAERIRAELGWTPRYADLDLIVKTALDWETRLSRRNEGDQAPPL